MCSSDNGTVRATVNDIRNLSLRSEPQLITSSLGMSIGSSLKQLAERRTDIFGAGDEETVIGKKIGEEDTRKPEKVTWDGHTASMAATSRLAQQGVTLEQQIEAIHKSKGLT